MESVTTVTILHIKVGYKTRLDFLHFRELNVTKREGNKEEERGEIKEKKERKRNSQFS